MKWLGKAILAGTFIVALKAFLDWLKAPTKVDVQDVDDEGGIEPESIVQMQDEREPERVRQALDEKEPQSVELALDEREPA